MPSSEEDSVSESASSVSVATPSHLSEDLRTHPAGSDYVPYPSSVSTDRIIHVEEEDILQASWRAEPKSASRICETGDAPKPPCTPADLVGEAKVPAAKGTGESCIRERHTCSPVSVEPVQIQGHRHRIPRGERWKAL